MPFIDHNLLIFALTYLLLKHYVGDFVAQSRYQLINKGRYGHPGGVLHASIHGLLTLPLGLLMPGVGLAAMLPVVLAEILFHYHVDWGKARLVRFTGWSTADRGFWQLFGLDQLLHLLSYLAIAWWLSSSV